MVDITNREEVCKLTGQDYELYPNTDGWNPSATFSVGDIFTLAYSPYAGIWCNSSEKYFIQPIEPDADGNPRFQIKEKSEEELAAEKLAEELANTKAERADAVSKIVVEVDDMKFDGDELAQNRISRVLAVAQTLGYDPNTTKQLWVLADNTYAEVTVAQLAKVLELAGKAQTELWVLPSYKPHQAYSQA